MKVEFRTRSVVIASDINLYLITGGPPAHRSNAKFKKKTLKYLVPTGNHSLLMPLTVDTHAVGKNSPARAHLKSEKSRNIYVSLEVLHVHPVLSGVSSCRKRVQILPKILMYLSLYENYVVLCKNYLHFISFHRPRCVQNELRTMHLSGCIDVYFQWYLSLKICITRSNDRTSISLTAN